MKFVRYQDRTGAAQYGVLEGDTVRSASGDPFSGLRAEDPVGEVGDLTLLPPVVPGKIVCIGLNYAAHVTENDASREVPDEPVMFMKPGSSLVGNGAEIKIANPQNATDYEAELAIVIGREARNVEEARASDYVLGITAANDVSDRVLQKKDGQWVRAKGYDTYCPLGPCVQTEFDLTSRDIKVESRLNGEVRQSQKTSSMIFSPRFLIAFISRVMTLNPGDVILTGTPEGVGPMKAGDTIEVEVGGVGTLRNPVGTA
jgi:2-keto-4-pentenoate hydratase/2-oxohepta-3-ene-1,7-dioic acid hydratase in catechol pathway